MTSDTDSAAIDGTGGDASPARAGWDEAFAAMAAAGDDQMLDETLATSWDDANWEW